MRETGMTESRKHWMSVLARASAADIRAQLDAAGPLPAHIRLRGPESGLAMVRGRAGGTGTAFNLGEMTVTRCTVRDPDGRLGHAMVAGRDMVQAELAAALDAALQDPARQAVLQAAVIAPLHAAQQAARDAVAAKAAATRVAFFTLATMRS